MDTGFFAILFASLTVVLTICCVVLGINIFNLWNKIDDIEKYIRNEMNKKKTKSKNKK